MADEKGIAVFLGEFDYQIREIDRIYEIIQTRMRPDVKNPMPDELVESIGYWLHNLYCAYEDLFKIVCSFWENNISSASGYHTSLLKRMVFGIEGIRPALLSVTVFVYSMSLGLFDIFSGTPILMALIRNGSWF